MAESVAEAIAGIRKMPKLAGKKEKEIVKDVVLRVIQALGWNTYDQSQVKEQLTVGDGKDRVDVVLNPGMPSAIFVEVKNFKVNVDHSNSEKQLINYCQSDPSVNMALLTNGKIWCLYLPKHEAPAGPHGGMNWRGKRFARVDIMDGSPKRKATELERFLARSLDSGEMLQNAEQEIQNRQNAYKAEEELVRVWNAKVARRKPAPQVINTLVHLLSEEGGFVPSHTQVTDFLSTRHNQFSASSTTGSIAEKNVDAPK